MTIQTLFSSGKTVDVEWFWLRNWLRMQIIIVRVSWSKACLKDMCMTGLASASAMVRQKPKEYRRKVDTTTRRSVVCSNTWPNSLDSWQKPCTCQEISLLSFLLLLTCAQRNLFSLGSVFDRLWQRYRACRQKRHASARSCHHTAQYARRHLLPEKRRETGGFYVGHGER